MAQTFENTKKRETILFQREGSRLDGNERFRKLNYRRVRFEGSSEQFIEPEQFIDQSTGEEYGSLTAGPDQPYADGIAFYDGLPECMHFD